jgi:hypothetical protein
MNLLCGADASTLSAVAPPELILTGATKNYGRAEAPSVPGLERSGRVEQHLHHPAFIFGIECLDVGTSVPYLFATGE